MATSSTVSSQEALERAERNFKKKEMQAREASKAMAEYEARLRAEREKTARLRALREAKEAADATARAAVKAAGDGGAKGTVRKPAKKRMLAAAGAK